MEPSVRKCTVRKWEDFNGYGFNLHAEKGKAGQYVGHVDEGSPAEAGGLRKEDRIVEVNGTNICNENHQQVVTRIRNGGNSVILLVVDKESDAIYNQRKIVITGDMEGVTTIVCPESRESAPSDSADSEGKFS